MMTWILANWDNILAIYGAAVAFCTTVVKFTSTTKDDAIWEKVIKVLDFLSTAYRKIDAEKLKK
jgi:hypothetical protein